MVRTFLRTMSVDLTTAVFFASGLQNQLVARGRIKENI